MKKNGFTLVELIAVISILAILLIIIVPVISSSSSNAKLKIYNTKIKMIEDSAIIYGQDHYKEIIDKAELTESGYSIITEDGIDYRTHTLTVKDLIPEYYDAESEESGKFVVDPRENGKYLDNYEIIIYINKGTRKVTAKVKEP